jgi:hypothetical protein
MKVYGGVDVQNIFLTTALAEGEWSASRPGRFIPVSNGQEAGYSELQPVTVACLRSLGRWDRAFESHSGHGCLVCVCVYSVCVVLRLGSGLATG